MGALSVVAVWIFFVLVILSSGYSTPSFDSLQRKKIQTSLSENDFHQNGGSHKLNVIKNTLEDVYLNKQREESFKNQFRGNYKDIRTLQQEHATDGNERYIGSLSSTQKENLKSTTDEEHSDIRSHRTVRTVTAKEERIWEYGVIPYEVDRVFTDSQRALFRNAMNHWENFTCIKFVERDPILHPNFIVFTIRGCGCCSFVGKRGNGGQAISIGRDCDKFGIVVHELGHVIGFWHEHTRPDRDEHIIIDKTNIIKDQEYNFKVLTNDEVDSLGMPYNYDSIMHYARNTFSKSSYLDTIIPIDTNGKGRPEIGQRYKLSEGDIAQANMLYKCPKCGKTFQMEFASFMSPFYGVEEIIENVPERCEWRISTFRGERIQLIVENLNIFESENCTVDYLEIRDGYWEKSPLLERLCGNLSGLEIITSSNRAVLRYVNTHRHKGYKGFSANYTAICGGNLTTDTDRRIISPNYPLNYLPSMDCTWRITAPLGSHVALKFDLFQLEYHDSCKYDFLRVENGETTSTYCGNELPPTIKSVLNELVVTFSADKTVQKMGFSAMFVNEVDECALNNHGCEHMCINTFDSYKCVCNVGFELGADGKTCQDACGGLIEVGDNAGTLTSPLFPDNYPNFKDCSWELVTSKNRKIFLNFTHFNLEGGKQHLDCNYDNVRIFSSVNDQLKHLGTFCGSSAPPIIISDDSVLRVEFHSDKSIQRSGFSVIYYTDIDECAENNGGCKHFCENTFGSYTCTCRNGYYLHENGHDCNESACKHELFEPYGNFKSPNYPEIYPPNSDCVWSISVLPGHRVWLLFMDFEIEFHQECFYDRLTIYDGSSPYSSSLAKLCGSAKPYPILSTTNQVYVSFISDNTSQHAGFMMSYSTVCGGYLRATNTTQQFYSHSRYGLKNYKRNMDCTWTIQSDPDYSVQIQFRTFEVEFSDNCNYDYVEVYDGSDPRGNFFGKFCGNLFTLQMPPNITSVSDTLVVHFRSDNSMSMEGFLIEFTEVEPSDDYETIITDSSEIVTPFPGYQKSIYLADLDDNGG